MAHPTVMQAAKASGGDIQNGSLVTLVSPGISATGVLIQRADPDINSFVPSGELNASLSGRFDEYYGGPPTGP